MSFRECTTPDGVEKERNFEKFAVGDCRYQLTMTDTSPYHQHKSTNFQDMFFFRINCFRNNPPLASEHLVRRYLDSGAI